MTDRELLAELATLVDEALGATDDMPDPAQAEWIVAPFVATITAVSPPADAALVCRALAALDTADATTALHVFARCGPREWREPAEAAIARARPAHPRAHEIGTLRCVRARTRTDGPVRAYAFQLDRPGSASPPQIAILGVGPDRPDGSAGIGLVEIFPPGPPETTWAELERNALAQEAAWTELPVAEVHALGLVELARASALPADEVGPLLVLLEALGCTPSLDDLPQLLPPDGALDDDELLADELLATFLERAARVYPDGSPVAEVGGQVVEAMLHWKLEWGDGLLTTWTVDDLQAFLLDWVPAEMTVPPDEAGDVVLCVGAMLLDLDAQGRLLGDDGQALRSAATSMRRNLADGLADESCWSPAKRLTMALIEDGIDPGDEDAVDAWIAARRRASTPPSKPSDAAARKRRRANERKARKRNRR